MYIVPDAARALIKRARAGLSLLAALVGVSQSASAQTAAGATAQGKTPPAKVGTTKTAAPKSAPPKETPRVLPEPRPVPGAAWAMPDPADLVERVIRRIVTQDKPGAVPINDYRMRAFGRAATVAAVRSYLGRNVELPSSVFSSVSDWADAPDRLPYVECAESDSACAAPSTVWLAVTKFERGDLPHEMNVWYTTSFVAKPHDQVITSRYAFCERWLRVGGTWRYDGFIRVVGG